MLIYLSFCFALLSLALLCFALSVFSSLQVDRSEVDSEEGEQDRESSIYRSAHQSDVIAIYVSLAYHPSSVFVTASPPAAIAAQQQIAERKREIGSASLPWHCYVQLAFRRRLIYLCFAFFHSLSQTVSVCLCMSRSVSVSVPVSVFHCICLLQPSLFLFTRLLAWSLSMNLLDDPTNQPSS